MSDLISRQDVIDSIVAWTVEDRPDIEMPTDLVDRVNSLPSADASLMQDRCKIDASSNLINRQDAIDEVIHLWADKPFGNPALVEIKDCIEALPSADRSQAWIPCSERLPEPLQEVLVTSENGGVYTSRIAHGDFEYGGNVIAWMPLPEPWKGKFCPNCGTEMQNAKQELVKDSDGLVKDLVNEPRADEWSIDPRELEEDYLFLWEDVKDDRTKNRRN